MKIYRPKLEDLWFRQEMMEDQETMAYNHAYGGTISFPKDKWEEWYNRYMFDDSKFYAYIKDEDNNFVGDLSYRYDEEDKINKVSILIHAKYRGKGYGDFALKSLCETAKSKGVKELYDDIAIDNPSINLFLKNGFVEEYRTDEYIMVKKVL